VVSGRRSALVIPIHKELKRGTLARILREAGLHIDDLRRLLDR
jgi:predicted RNA binding protein YcfA (HicA-like mRNA interferase family)